MNEHLELNALSVAGKDLVLARAREEKEEGERRTFPLRLSISIHSWKGDFTASLPSSFRKAWNEDWCPF